MNKNKNFRKSAIVIPALALMVLTAGASATGAVAWFTATRTQTATASTFTAYDPNGALKITASANADNGTSLATGSKVNILAQTGSSTETKKSVLRDASYDNENQKLYRAVMNNDTPSTSSNPTPTGYSEVTKYDTGNVVATAKEQASANAKVFYALSWDYTFEYDSINTAGSALFFDLTSSFSDTETTNPIAKGFRIAFHATEGDHSTAASGTSSESTSTKVDNASLSHFTWTNNTDKASDGTEVDPKTPSTYKENQYVGETKITDEPSTTKIEPTTYVAYKLLSTDSSYKKIEDAEKRSTDLATTAGWLGTFTSGTQGVNQIKVHVVAWYEGTDNNVIDNNANSKESITATMKFYVRDLAKATA